MGRQLETDFVHATSLRSIGFLCQNEPPSTPTDIAKGTPSHPTDESLSSASFFLPALDDSFKAHAWKAVSHAVSERQLETGEAELGVIDKDGGSLENFSK
jgi:hypothetical protein